MISKRLVTAMTALAACSAAVAATPSASAGPLANGYKKISDQGMTVQTWRAGESALPGISMAGNGIGRSAVLAGTIRTTLSKGQGRLRVGYLVGCQVSVGTLSAGLTGAISATGPTATGSISFPLAPGQIKAVQLSTQQITTREARYQYSGVEIEVQGCGGAAQARSYAKVEAVEGYAMGTQYANNIGGSGAYIQSTLYGQPFNLN